MKGVRSTTSQKSWLSWLCKRIASARLINGAPQANRLYFMYVGGSSRRGSDATVAYRWWHIAANQQITDTRRYCRLRPSEMQSSESWKLNGEHYIRYPRKSITSGIKVSVPPWRKRRPSITQLVITQNFIEVITLI